MYHLNSTQLLYHIFPRIQFQEYEDNTVLNQSLKQKMTGAASSHAGTHRSGGE